MGPGVVDGLGRGATEMRPRWSTTANCLALPRANCKGGAIKRAALPEQLGRPATTKVRMPAQHVPRSNTHHLSSTSAPMSERCSERPSLQIPGLSWGRPSDRPLRLCWSRPPTHFLRRVLEERARATRGCAPLFSLSPSLSLTRNGGVGEAQGWGGALPPPPFCLAE